MAANKHKLVVHLSKSLDFTAFDVKWVPRSARLVVIGSNAPATGTLEVLEMNSQELQTIGKTQFPHSLKCGTFRASDVCNRHFAFGDFHGHLRVVDLTVPDKPVFNVKGHKDIINSVDGVGGLGVGKGAAELVTGGSDSVVNVWDPRQPNDPVVNIVPDDSSHHPDCWTVAAGNAHSVNDRAVAAGFDNGDIKIFDLRTGKVYWETNVHNGVCSIEFDRRDIMMNKVVASTLEANIHVFDCRTLDARKNFAGCRLSAHKSTVWCIRHLPQNRDVWASTGGDGSIRLFQYQYSSTRSKKDNSGHLEGVPGKVVQLESLSISNQPVTSFDWNSDRLGLAACTALDQRVRIMIATQLNTL